MKQTAEEAGKIAAEDYYQMSLMFGDIFLKIKFILWK